MNTHLLKPGAATASSGHARGSWMTQPRGHSGCAMTRYGQRRTFLLLSPSQWLAQVQIRSSGGEGMEWETGILSPLPRSRYSGLGKVLTGRGKYGGFFSRPKTRPTAKIPAYIRAGGGMVPFYSSHNYPISSCMPPSPSCDCSFMLNTYSYLGILNCRAIAPFSEGSKKERAHRDIYGSG